MILEIRQTDASGSKFCFASRNNCGNVVKVGGRTQEDIFATAA